MISPSKYELPESAKDSPDKDCGPEGHDTPDSMEHYSNNLHLQHELFNLHSSSAQKEIDQPTYSVSTV